MKIFEQKVKDRPWILPVFAVLLTGLGVLVYLLASHGNGFPLDDAWIHQTYARNLVEYGQWSYFSDGTISGGSTSPLWTLLLSFSNFSGLSKFLWVFLLGAIALFSIGLLSTYLLNYWGIQKSILIVFLIVFEWHLLWAALSGMETILQALFVVLVFFLLSRKSPNFLIIGLLIGLSVWVRPDGITLLGPSLFIAGLARESKQERRNHLLLLFAGLIVMVIPYLFFNQVTSGQIFPATFYAKQAEYQSMVSLPLFTKLINLYSVPFIGVGILLLPGFVYLCLMSFTSRDTFTLSIVLWILGFIAIYVWRLPVNYQHGRYLIPVIPMAMIAGLIGTMLLIRRIKDEKKTKLVNFAFILLIVIVQTGFLFIGSKQYAEDIAIIETEMVKTAKWINENTDPDALFAVHDIGAFGYYADRKFVDLAGLVSPEVIPFIRDELRLAEFLSENQVDYLVIFPDWYKRLDEMGKVVYKTESTVSPSAGGENMYIYQWIGK